MGPVDGDACGEQQGYKDATDMILHVFSCVAYIREFFGEDSFVDCKFGEMNLKKIYRGVTRSADTLIDWIERGCFDALRHKYLETVTMGIFTDPEQPETVIETYTMNFSYPSSREHEIILKLRSSAANREGIKEQQVKVPTVAASLNAPFKQQIVKMLRTLCILIQTLGPLPTKRYASMQMTYYDELTPRDYEPPCFTSAVFDLDYLFKDPARTFKHDFGIVLSEHHRVRLVLQTSANGDLEREEQQAAKDVGVPDDIVASQMQDIPPVVVEAAHRKDTQETITVPEADKKDNGEVVLCLCADTCTDLDMIYCDECGTWQHTPCAGFCTNRDKRIPDKYVCLNCEYRGNKKLLKNLEDLASFRRAISVVFSEGLQSISWLSKRLDCGVAKASRLIRRLESEGLVSRPNSQVKSLTYAVHKTAEAKDKIRFFFGLDLTAFPELRQFFASKDKRRSCAKLLQKQSAEEPPVKRRRSVTAEHISCVCN